MNHRERNLQDGLPASLDTERFVLGSILLDATRWPIVASVLSARDFVLESHRRIWAIFESMDAEGEKIDHVTVANRLASKGEIESIGGFSYLVSLDEGLPLIPNIDEYLNVVRDHRIRRDIVIAARRIEEMVMLGETATNSAERAMEILTGISQDSDRGKSFPLAAEIIAQNGGLNGWMAGRKELGMPTGYPLLDESTGGLMPTDLWVIAGSTGGGKSTFTRNMAFQMAMSGLPGAIVSLEMGEQQIIDGLISIPSGLHISDLKRGIIRDRGTFRDAMYMVNELPIHVDCRAITLPGIRAGLMRLRQKGGCRWAIVDFLQLMQSVTRAGNREQEVAGFAYGLKRMAIELDMGIIAISQLSREHAKLKRKPELSDLRESGAIEQAANFIGFVHSEYQESAMEEYPAELLIRKQRSGDGNIDIGFGWKKSSGCFIERAYAR